jgi:hypothetical protein
MYTYNFFIIHRNFIFIVIMNKNNHFSLHYIAYYTHWNILKFNMIILILIFW